jgi:IS1 family transposase
LNFWLFGDVKLYPSSFGENEGIGTRFSGISAFLGRVRAPSSPNNGASQMRGLSSHAKGLALDGPKRAISEANAKHSSDSQQDAEAPSYPIRQVSLRIPLNRDVCGGEFADRYGSFFVLGWFAIGIIFEGIAFTVLLKNGRSKRGWFFAGIAFCGWFLGGITPMIGRLPWDWGKHYDCTENNERENLHSGRIVPRKCLTSNSYWGTVIDMANVLPKDKQIAVIGALAEGSSLRSIERITGIHHDTAGRLAVKVGQGCAALLDSSMRNLSCNRLEMDEIWGFVGKKDRNVREGEDGVGSVWTFCAIDAETKLVPAFKCGNRDTATAKAFVQDVASRMAYRVQISTDGLAAYVPAMEAAFGEFVDYGQIIKTYGHEEVSDNRRYSAAKFVSAEKKVVIGIPDERLISTSYVERLNATTRLHMRRLTRLTLAFSKKRENFEAAVALHFAYYNFVKRHNTLRCTPAMAAGVTGTFWSVGDLIEAAA